MCEIPHVRVAAVVVADSLPSGSLKSRSLLTFQSGSFGIRHHRHHHSVSTIFIFKLLRRYANKSTRVHQQVSTRKRDVAGKQQLDPAQRDGGRSNGACEVNSSSASTTPSDDSATTTASGGTNGAADDETNHSISSRGFAPGGVQGTNSTHNGNHPKGGTQNLDALDDSQRNGGGQLITGDANRASPRHVQLASAAYQQKSNYSIRADGQGPRDHSDGIYRVPESRSSFGTRYMAVGNGQQQQQQQQQIWSTSYGHGDSSATASPFIHQEYKPADIHSSHHLLAYYQQGGHSLAGNNNNNNNRGMSTTNQLTTISGDGAQVGGQRYPQHRPQPATISVNGKQLYC